MKRVIILITLPLMLLICVSDQWAQSSTVETVKPKGKILVKKLPRKVQGVTLRKGAVRLKPGHKFVKQEDGTVTVARIAGGGLGIGGTWNCDCTTGIVAGKGTCSVMISGGSLLCLTGTCNASCSLAIEVEGLKTNIIRF